MGSSLVIGVIQRKRRSPGRPRAASRPRRRLGLAIRQLLGVGTPRGLSGRFAALMASLLGLFIAVGRALDLRARFDRAFSILTPGHALIASAHLGTTFSTGC